MPLPSLVAPDNFFHPASSRSRWAGANQAKGLHNKLAYNGRMTELLFRNEPYRKTATATVTEITDAGVILDQTICYPLGGGQPGDQGTLVTVDGLVSNIEDTRHGGGGKVLHILSDRTGIKVGKRVDVELDWARRYAHMRMHTGLHLLGAVIPFGVTGGNISATRSRLDFDMQETLDKEEVTKRLNRLIEGDHPVTSRWITQEELAAQPDLVRTMSVRPPANVARLRLLEIPGIDLQPCGGTHVARTAEIGRLAVAKVEKKGRHNRRVHIVFA